MKDDEGGWCLHPIYMTDEEVRKGVKDNFTWCKEYQKTSISIMVDVD